VQVWDAATGKHMCTYPGHTARVNAVAWSPDSKYIVSCSNDKTVQVWLAP
jgi:WD40 repeat protein